jgi:hypothetical protein
MQIQRQLEMRKALILRELGSILIGMLCRLEMQRRATEKPAKIRY